MNNNEFDRLMDEALHIPLPQGLAGRLEEQIDRLAAREKRRRARRIYWPAGIAAAVLLGIVFFLQTEKTSLPADTYTDPLEAAVAAEKALSFMSAQLNKGLAQVSTAGEEFEKVNQVLNKHLK